MNNQLSNLTLLCQVCLPSTHPNASVRWYRSKNLSMNATSDVYSEEIIRDEIQCQDELINRIVKAQINLIVIPSEYYYWCQIEDNETSFMPSMYLNITSCLNIENQNRPQQNECIRLPSSSPNHNGVSKIEESK